MRTIAWAMTLVGIALSCNGCSKPTPTKGGGSDAHKERVSVSHPQPESKLTTITLSDEARSHLDIQTVPARREKVANHRTYGGAVVVPEGRSIMISAPLAGTIGKTESESFPQPGAVVSAGDALFRLIPSLQGQGEVLNPADRIAMVRARADLESARAQALGDVEAANARLGGTKVALERAQKLVEENAGSVRSLDEATANHRMAQAALDAAQVRRDVIESTLNSLSGKAESSALQITVPFGGIVQRLLVAPNEVIAMGAPLCEIAATDPLWVRVSAYVGDIQRLARNEAAVARRLGDAGELEARLAPVIAPPTATSTTATVDLYYELDNASGEFQAGERLIVSIPTKGSADALIVPKVSVLYDIHGDSWVYITAEDGTYVRKRVSIARSVGDHVEVVRGIVEGDPVVTTGAPELFGIEFGTSGH
ncbi:MAG: efflux RND transporter periplasmic adaptor subunit [Phycisphaerae bacterium]|nr:efflux RND transporter periplasmic adaptor subunit [Phycisphaerales bacterium]